MTRQEALEIIARYALVAFRHIEEDPGSAVFRAQCARASIQQLLDDVKEP